MIFRKWQGVFLCTLESTYVCIRWHTYTYFRYVSWKNLKRNLLNYRCTCSFKWNKQPNCGSVKNAMMTTILNQNLSLIFQRQSLFRSYSPPKIIEKITDCFLSQIWRQNALLFTSTHTVKEVWHSSSWYFLSLVYLTSLLYLISLLNLGCKVQ